MSIPIRMVLNKISYFRISISKNSANLNPIKRIRPTKSEKISAVIAGHILLKGFISLKNAIDIIVIAAI